MPMNCETRSAKLGVESRLRTIRKTGYEQLLHLQAIPASGSDASQVEWRVWKPGHHSENGNSLRYYLNEIL